MSKTKAPNTPELASLRRQMYRLNFHLYTFLEFAMEAREKTYGSAEEWRKLCSDMRAHMKHLFEKMLAIERDLGALEKNEQVAEAMRQVTEYCNRLDEIAEIFQCPAESTEDILDDGWVIVEDWMTD